MQLTTFKSVKYNEDKFGAHNTYEPLTHTYNMPENIRNICDACYKFSSSIVGNEKYEAKSIMAIAKEVQLSEFSQELLSREIHSPRGLHDLKFENNGFQLSEIDAASPFVGQWTAGTLNLIIQEVGSTLNPNCKLSLAFPDKQIPFKMCMVDRIAPNSGILPEFYGYNTPIPVVKNLDTHGLVYEAALYAGRTILSSSVITSARKLGAVGFDERGIGQLIGYNAVNLLTQTYVRKNYQLAQAVYNNGFVWANKVISSNIPSENYIALDPMGTLNANGTCDYNNPDPLYSPLKAIFNILSNPAIAKYRNYIKAIILNAVDFQNIMQHPNVQPIINSAIMGTTSLGNRSLKLQINNLTQEFSAYYAPDFEIPLVSDSDVWVSQDAEGNIDNSKQNFFTPQGKMFVMMDIPGLIQGGYHLTNNEIDLNQVNPAMGIYTGVFQRDLTNSDCTNSLHIVASLAGAPAVYAPESCIILTTLYNNV